ncbi:MAG TPA: histidine kinase [Aeromicrobium sp.]|nr:histidine kinase [Aeromicrobium sp.]HKY59067.1 histidine kinase [Aeromicrobium sp.]
MHLSVPPLLRRVETTSLEHGVAYPWWMPVLCKSGQLLATAMAFLQRDAFGTWQFPAVLALIILPIVYEVATASWLPSWARFVPNAAVFAVILTLPIAANLAIDAVVVVLALMVADFQARDGSRIGVAVALAAAAALPMLDSISSGPALLLSLFAIALGLEGGYMVLWGARALFAERQARAEAYERATLAERDRIAREIHDLVAHSLSVTMLQVTAARRILNDLPDPTHEISEAVDALSDAERIGRQAMSDIRQTVSGMSATSGRHPLPTVDDLPALVEQFRAAGQPVDVTTVGDLSGLTAPVSLGLYRVAQESLANVVKHAGGAAAEVELEVTARQARLTVRNPAAPDRTPADAFGTGLAGMKARVEQLGGHLTAGRGGDAWVVRAIVPLGGLAHGRALKLEHLEPVQ